MTICASRASVGVSRAELLIVAAVFELAFGVWLVAGIYRRATRWLALTWFTTLAVVAIVQAARGAASCACFGASLHISPWLMFAFDAAAVAALWTWSPHDNVSRRPLLAILYPSLLAATVFLGLAGTVDNQTMFAEIDLGDMAQGELKQHAFSIPQ